MMTTEQIDRIFALVQKCEAHPGDMAHAESLYRYACEAMNTSLRCLRFVLVDAQVRAVSVDQSSPEHIYVRVSLHTAGELGSPHHVLVRKPSQRSIQPAIDALNTAYAADENAVRTAMGMLIPCSPKMPDDFALTVRQEDAEPITVTTPLTLLNAVLLSLDLPAIAAVYTAGGGDGRCLGFAPYVAPIAPDRTDNATLFAALDAVLYAQSQKDAHGAAVRIARLHKLMLQRLEVPDDSAKLLRALLVDDRGTTLLELHGAADFRFHQYPLGHSFEDIDLFLQRPTSG